MPIQNYAPAITHSPHFVFCNSRIHSCTLTHSQFHLGRVLACYSQFPGILYRSCAKLRCLIVYRTNRACAYNNFVAGGAFSSPDRSVPKAVSRSIRQYTLLWTANAFYIKIYTISLQFSDSFDPSPCLPRPCFTVGCSLNFS
jgi:hypothetical protein